MRGRSRNWYRRVSRNSRVWRCVGIARSTASDGEFYADVCQTETNCYQPILSARPLGGGRWSIGRFSAPGYFIAETYLLLGRARRTTRGYRSTKGYCVGQLARVFKH
jgi:hypothetical protein